MTIVSSWHEVPSFASEAEESAFWATHQLGAGLLAQMTADADPSLPIPRSRTKPISLRFDEDTIRRAKTVASRRGKGYQTLLKEFISERLYEEEKRDGARGEPGGGGGEINVQSGSLKGMADTTRGTASQVAKRGDRHVVRASKGGWNVVAPGAQRASSHHATQAEAIRRARQIVQNEGGGQVVIHNRQGAIRDSETVPPGEIPN
jgi:hypothetical protein